MLRLTIIRHAKSSWDYPELSDFERPLNARGRRDAPAMARRFADVSAGALRLLSSPALRAITTAHVFAGALGIDPVDIRIEPRIYEASLDTLLELAQALNDTDTHVLLVGHNPGLSELAGFLADRNVGELPTCAVVTLGFNTSRWRGIKAKSGAVERLDTPRKGEAH